MEQERAKSEKIDLLKENRKTDERRRSNAFVEAVIL